MPQQESNLVSYARSELQRAGLFAKDSDYDGALGPAVLRMVEAFSQEGHSGYSAATAMSLFEKVARYEPLTPLTGEDDEWNEVGTGLYQNRRCSSVFKDTTIGVYDIDGKVFREPNGNCFTNRRSRVFVEFPYTPKTEYVDVDALADDGAA